MLRLAVYRAESMLRGAAGATLALNFDGTLMILGYKSGHLNLCERFTKGK